MRNYIEISKKLNEITSELEECQKAYDKNEIDTQTFNGHYKRLTARIDILKWVLEEQ